MMNIKSALVRLMTAAILLVVLPIRAADVDLFTLGTSGIEPPNILFMIDNSANWNSNSQGVTKRQIAHEALYKFLDAIKADIADKKFNFGLMVFASGNSPRGGKVYEHFTLLDSVPDIQALQSRLYCQNSNDQACQDQLGMEWGSAGFDPNLFYGEESIPGTNNAPYATMFNESLLYYGGEPPASGLQDGAWSSSNTEGYDADAVNLGDYVSPMSSTSCAKSYNILVGNGGPDSGENNDAEALLRDLGGVFNSDPISLTPSNSEANWGDEFSRYLADNDVNTNIGGTQSVSTFVLDVFDTSANQNNPQQAAHVFLESIATQGNGAYYAAADVDEVVDSLLRALNEILAVSSVFASTSLPVSVNVRGTSLNQVYMGVFRPRDTQQWTGNLKLYQLGLDSNDNVELVDADGNLAEDATSGFIRLDARSFWTEDSNYWTWTTTTDGEQQDSDSPDGKEVERGGNAQSMREDVTPANRVVYTCDPANCNSMTTFDTSNTQISQADLGAASGAERDDIINWVRGQDVKDDNGDGDTSEMRAFVHGDVVHSEPVVINYGDAGTYVFYGANDGVFRAVDGGTDETTGSTDGQEVWGFVAPEFYGDVKEIYDNDPFASLASFDDKKYFFDGVAGSYVVSDADGNVTEAYLFVTVRRGGRFMYAFDITDPENPNILWKIDNTEAGYAELGETWSRPVVTEMNINGTSTPVIIMGMGYDPAVDDTNTGSNTMGRGIAVIDASDGNLIWQVGPSPSGADYNLTESGMVNSIPSDVGVLDRNADGFADRMYVGDTGAQLWRVDTMDANPSNWTITKLLDAETSGQKFLHMPIVAAAPSGNYDAVILGTGDREDPLDDTQQDYFIVYKDRDQSGVSTVTTASDLTSDLLEVEPGVTDLGSLTADERAKYNLGWYMPFDPGEKMVGRALTFNEVSIFNTHSPSGGSGCEQLGTARRYALNPFEAVGVLDNDELYESVSGGGLIPDPVVAIVELENADGDMVLTPVFCTGPDCGTVPNVSFGVREPIYWYLNRDD